MTVASKMDGWNDDGTTMFAKSSFHPESPSAHQVHSCVYTF